jgi:MFS family permease
VDRALRLSLLEGLFAILFINWSTGVLVTGYALSLGAGPQALALLGALPFLAQLAAPLALLLKGSRKALAVRLNLLARGGFALALLLPLLPEKVRVPGLLLVSAFSQLLSAPVGVLWLSWMADLVPPEKRGAYFGLRNALLGLVGTLGNLLGGYAVDRLPRLGYPLVLGLGVLSGLLSVGVLRLQPEPRPAPAAPPWPQLQAALSDRAYLRYLLLVLAWFLAVMLGGPFVVPYFLSWGGLSMTQVGLWTVVSASSGLLFGPLWGRVADRRGHAYVLFWTGLVAALMPLFWLSASAAFPWPIWASALLDALAWSGLNPALTNLALGRAPASARNGYLALFWVALGLGGILGSLLAGGLSGPSRPTPYHLPILASALARLLVVLWLFPRERA